MSLARAKKKYREFHLKGPNRITKLGVEIPQFVCPVGYAVQISYRSNKWNDDEKWIDYIHWWENPTLVCVAEDDLDRFEEFAENMVFDLGKDRSEITFLGHAIDLNIAEDDRSDIELSSDSEVYTRQFNPHDNVGELEKIQESLAIPFNPNPKNSRDFVVCSPRGNVIYIVSEDEDLVLVLINDHCRVTSHGIEG